MYSGSSSSVCLSADRASAIEARTMRITFRTFVCDEDHRWSTPNPRKIPKLVHMGMYIGIVSGLILSTEQKNQNTVATLARYGNLCLRMVSKTSFSLELVCSYITNVMVGFMSRKTNVAMAMIQAKYVLSSISLMFQDICSKVAYERYFQSQPASCVATPMVIIPKIHIKANTSQRRGYFCSSVSPDA